MDRQSDLGAFDSKVDLDVDASCAEFRIYRPDGTLSVIYFAAVEGDETATSEAERIAQLGYQVDIWRGGTRIDQIDDRNISDAGESGTVKW